MRSNLPVRREDVTSVAHHPGELKDPITGLSVDVFPQNYGPKERGIVMAVCERYGLDPIAREVELLHGQVFITAKGINRIANQDPAFDGVEVEIIEQDWRRGFFVVKARAWRKGCAHPIEEYADSDGSKMRGGAKFRHTITRAKARALRAAFAIPFCSREELADDDVPRYEGPSQRPPTAPPLPPPTGREPAPPPTSEPASTASTPDPGTHPGEAWKSANAAARGNLHGQGISEDERKMLIRHYWGRNSFTELRAKHLKHLADAFNHPPTAADHSRETQALDMVHAAGGADKLTADDRAELIDLCENPWQVVLIYRALAGGAE